MFDRRNCILRRIEGNLSKCNCTKIITVPEPNIRKLHILNSPRIIYKRLHQFSGGCKGKNRRKKSTQKSTNFKSQKIREGCGCPKFLAGKVFRQLSTLLEKFLPPFSGSTKCDPCQGLGIFQQGKWLLENRPRLRERSWIFSSETATAVLTFYFKSEFGSFAAKIHTARIWLPPIRRGKVPYI